MEINKYLERIEVNSKIDVNLSSLRLIQKQHLLTVPFENLDIHLYNHLKVDLDSLYSKIVNQNRGGVCYELNLLLYYLLKNIGFNVKVLGAKVMDQNGSFFDHMLLIVELYDKKYLVDVGYGDNFLEPLEFKEGIVQKDNKGLFKVVKIDDIHFELKKFSQEINDYKIEYTFKNEEKEIDDFQNRIDYFIHSKESIFKKNLFCSLEKEDGRISLKHDKFLLTQNGIKRTEKIISSNQYIKCLNERFNIKLDLVQQEKIKKCCEYKKA
ncbi:arylamine N-acetyltransferase family protein [Brassicibacter mesophilus]|uniref:arylamine N-acetyltransferase family protein n=1 Tax=Brassicibacter mesophilus TaxID=745119 RepID=UPI003D2485C8